MKSIKAVLFDHEKKMETDPDYNIRYKLFVAMQNDFSVMAEHGDNTTSLLKELRNATPDIIQAYKEIYL